MGNHKVLRTAGCNLRYSMYEFIEAVHKHSIIWERRHPNFHNRELRDLAWQQIGQELCNNFEGASEPEKQEIVRTLLKRWKNTRDSYLRVNRLRQSGEEVARASYIYEKELSFLLGVKAETDDDDEPLKEEPKVSPVKRRRLAASQRAPLKRRCSSGQESDQEPSPQPENMELLLEDIPPITAENGTPQSDPNVNIHATPAYASTSTASSDPDQAFFDSIKPHMQRMCADRKLDFQIEVLKILRNFKPN
ncbi:uncharacterized protein Dana_GF18193 [Drosophila ananassae]|uniref:MADF domain-containing protein n=1 Tax=Drosophila ananassae TaxID=7217 RepID=B3LXX9_DROAN|nr:uncharacterized protein LOC6500971 [Drosophila ananassae]EDV42835.1 uncharacterized protein Dana_GF18193 [Drosophila ananassae]